MIIDRRFLETRWWGRPPEAALAAATGCGVFAWSRFGYGGSDSVSLPRPMRYIHDEAVEVLPRVLDAADVWRAVLVGHSDGGSIAAIHAGTVHDPTVLGVVMIAAHFFVEDINIASIRGIKATYEQGDLRRRLARYHRDVDVAFRGWNDTWLDSRFRTFDITEQVARIRVPVLALQGMNDPFGAEEQLRMLERIARCPVETRLIAGARHAPHLEARQPTLNAIVPFVRSVVMAVAT